MKGIQFQQGDVLFTKIDRLPKDIIPVNKNVRGYVLAEGEATGHAHVVKQDVFLYADKETDNEILYINSDTGFVVQHEEHKPLFLDKGIYRVDKVQEFDWVEMQKRKVRD